MQLAHETQTLNAGDILSYSAGSTQTGPEGYRKQSVASAIFSETKKRWPSIIRKLGNEPPIIINAYPAFMGMVPEGITVDTYLSPRVFSRALQLAAIQDKPAIVIGQPLFVAQLLFDHLNACYPLPKCLHLWMGGYPLPNSLREALVETFEPQVDIFQIIEYYGVAEITAGALMSKDRDIFDRPIFHARKDVEVHLQEDRLSIALKDENGNLKTEFQQTGDHAQPAGRGYLIWNHDRFSPTILDQLECWTREDWKRCTGYIVKDGNDIWIQTREGQTPKGSCELNFHDFASQFGFNWSKKPNWK